MKVRVKTVFTAVSFAAAVAAATSFNFQILATSGANSSGLEFAELAPPAPTVSSVETIGGVKTIIAYVTKTAEGRVIIKTIPAFTVTAEASVPASPTNAGGPTVTTTPTGPTVEPIPTVTSNPTTTAPAPSVTTVSTPAPSLTDAPVPAMTQARASGQARSSGQARIATKSAPSPSLTSHDDDDEDDDEDDDDDSRSHRDDD